MSADVIKCIPLVKTCDARDARGHIYNQQWRSTDLFLSAHEYWTADWLIGQFRTFHRIFSWAIANSTKALQPKWHKYRSLRNYK